MSRARVSTSELTEGREEQREELAVSEGRVEQRKK